jgi:hypothetical protein
VARRSKRRRRRVWIPILLLSLVGALAGGGYALVLYVRPYLHGTDCQVSAKEGSFQLDLEQASNAATIAAVADRKKLPEQAVVIAYATAFQESKIHNLPGGDRDSVGLFQQRPSMGWGKAVQLDDPVYATSRFFDALVKVKHYQTRAVYDAAQRVQHSADGTAYAQHEDAAKVLAAGYTGREPGIVRCWFSPDRRTPERRTAVIRQLQYAFGSPQVNPMKDQAEIIVADRQRGWNVASWAVSQAQGYGLTEIRFAGRHWTADDGFAGWTSDDNAPGDRVIIR